MKNILAPSSSNANPNALSIKTRFAINFVSAMKRLNKSRVVRRDRYQRYRAVRAAARTSMACAVGPDRAWSRAVLRNSRRMSRKGEGRRNPRENLVQEQHLRGLVPGGQQMAFCTLLTETAHYIKCLQAQVQVMTDILHTCTSSSTSTSTST